MSKWAAYLALAISIATALYVYSSGLDRDPLSPAYMARHGCGGKVCM